MGKRNGGLLKNAYTQGPINFLRVTGELYGDTRWKDGTTVTTSNVIKFDLEKGILETRNTIYTLEITKENKNEQRL